MTDKDSTLIELTHQIGGELINFGPPPPAPAPPSTKTGATQIVSSFGSYETEYAAIRQRVGILHQPQRCVLKVTGKDANDFLHRMVTCNVNILPTGGIARGFQLNNKGRLLADFMLLRGDSDTWLETDIFDIAELKSFLESRLFVEEVALEDWTDQREKLVLHGPAAVALLSKLADDPKAAQQAANTANTHHVIHCDKVPVTAYRFDDAGSLALHLLVPKQEAPDFYRKLLYAAGYQPHAELTAEYAQARRQSLRGEPIGWLAYNTARIEAGTPLFHIDFAEDSLPAETGILEDTVSFNKGCYPGQEIVARMKNLGHPKRVLVGLKFSSNTLPVAGTQVLASPDDPKDPSDVIGGITSSTLSPLLGETPIAFAVIKWGHHKIGQTVRVPCEGELAAATVTELNFLKNQST